MSKYTVVRRFLAVFIALCLVLPGAAVAKGKSGKKNYKEGVKYEQLQQWDMAAQQFALAVSAEPNNAEYKLHYIRALQQASVMFVKRGDSLAEQNDFASAFTAYRQAYNYDQGNEIARLKMERMLELQKAQASGGDPINPNKIGNIMPTGGEIQVAAKPRSRDVAQNINFKEGKFKTVVTTLGKQLGLNVVYDESVKDQPVTIDLVDVTLPKALDIIFKTYKFSFEQVDRRTILVYQDNPANRPRFETLLVKTFYLGNITSAQARTALQAMLPPGRQIASLEANNQGGNLLVVKATPTELQLVQDILGSLDKNKNEVVVDVEIYEVSRDSTLLIGNQINATQVGSSDNGLPSVGNLGGVGYNLAESAARAGTSLFNIGAGALIGLPPTTLSFLQSKGNSKLLYRTQIHALDGQKNTTKVGRSVPVKLGTTYGYGSTGAIGGVGIQPITGGAGNINAGLVGGVGYPGIDSIQYRDVGLVIEAKPVITNEGYVEIEMKFETSDVMASGATSDLTPTFTQRSLNTTARIKDGVTSVVAGVNQETRGDARSGLAFISMIPILGRFVSTPRQTDSQNDIIITVTPHIIRSQGINKDDHLAKVAGQQAAGPAPSVEQVVNRAQQEEEEERRLIAQQIPQTLPLNTPSQVQSTQAAGFNSAPRNVSQPVVQPVNNNPADERVQKVVNERSLDPAANTSVSVTPPAPASPIPPRPEQQPEQQPDNQNNQGKQSDGANNSKAKEKEKEIDDEVKAFLPPPPENFTPPEMVMTKRPERVTQALAKIQEERDRAAREAKANPLPEQAPAEYVLQRPQANAPVAIPKMPDSRSTAATFSLSPRPIRQQIGKMVTVAVEVSSQAQITGATIALRFDDTKLRFKSVKDTGLLGAKPELTYEVEKGNLVVRIKQIQPAPVKALGQLMLIEFSPIAEGQSEIVFNQSASLIRTSGNTNAPASGTPTQVIISRGSAITVTNDR